MLEGTIKMWNGDTARGHLQDQEGLVLLLWMVLRIMTYGGSHTSSNIRFSKAQTVSSLNVLVKKHAIYSVRSQNDVKSKLKLSKMPRLGKEKCEPKYRTRWTRAVSQIIFNRNHSHAQIPEPTQTQSEHWVYTWISMALCIYSVMLPLCIHNPVC